jgi:TonB family protein
MRIRLAFAACILLIAGISETRAFQDAQAPDRISVDAQVQKAKVIQQTAPEYPALARQTRIEGTVRLEAIIDKDGKVKELRVLSGHPLLIQSALNAVRQWQYAPTSLNGKRVKVLTEIDVIYTLERDPYADKPATPDEGSVSNGQYFSKFFKFTYRVPVGWTSYDAVAMAEIAKANARILSGGDSAKQEKFDASAKRTFKLLMTSQFPLGTAGKATRAITITAERVSDTPEIQSAQDYLLKLKHVAMDLNGSLQFPGEPYEVSYGGHKFFQIDGQGTSPEGLFYQEAVATMLQGYVLNFVFTSTRQPDLKALCKSLELLHFEN